MTWGEVLNCIEDILTSQDKYRSEREKIKQKFHLYTDNKNSERVFCEIIKEIG